LKNATRYASVAMLMERILNDLESLGGENWLVESCDGFVKVMMERMCWSVILGWEFKGTYKFCDSLLHFGWWSTFDFLVRIAPQICIFALFLQINCRATSTSEFHAGVQQVLCRSLDFSSVLCNAMHVLWLVVVLVFCWIVSLFIADVFWIKFLFVPVG